MRSSGWRPQGRLTVDRARIVEALEQIGLRLSDSQIEAFDTFEERLYEANRTMNLTRVPREECALRHFVDSLLGWRAYGLDEAAPPRTLLDIGTGPGFPAWPLACAFPSLEVTALDSSGKMLGFLRSNPLPNLRVEQERAESWGVRERFDVVTGRAVAPLAAQLELSAAPCKVGGKVVPMRTPGDAPEMERLASVLGLQLGPVEMVELPGTEVVRLFPVFTKVARTPRDYPRLWAEIRRKPL